MVISLNSIKELLFVIDNHVFFEVRTEFLTAIYINFMLQRVKNSI